MLQQLVDEALAFFRPMRSPRLRPRLGFIHPDGKIEWHNMSFEHGALFMGSGRGKDLFFASMALYIEREGITAAIFCADSWMAKLTPKGEIAMEADPNLLGKHDTEELEKLGYATRSQVLAMTCQNATDVLLVNISYTVEDGRLVFGEPQHTETPQAGFDGRLKLYGKPSDDCWHDRKNPLTKED